MSWMGGDRAGLGERTLMAVEGSACVEPHSAAPGKLLDKRRVAECLVWTVVSNQAFSNLKSGWLI